MNPVQFARLMHAIYRRGGPLPDLEWIQSLGLLAVKIGQIHALRIDFLEPETCEHLARLYRRNTALPPRDFEQMLAANTDRQFRREFASIDTQPLATASVGQVHRATLRGGRNVVIKLIKGDLRDRFVADVASLERMMRWAIRLYPRLSRVGDPLGILEDIESYTLAELDLRNEIAGQRTLRAIRELHAKRFDLGKLRFPEVYPELSGPNVLVSDYVDGATVDELLERGGLEYAELIELFRIQGFFMLCVGTFHGDLHPGNVIVAENGFHFVDSASVVSVSDRLRDGLFDFFAALSEYDYRSCARSMHRMSEQPLAAAGFDEFSRRLVRLYADFDNATVAEISLTRKMMQTIRLAVESGMRFERSIFGIIRSFMYLDGMVLRCNPDAVLMRDMRPALEEFRSAKPDETRAADVRNRPEALPVE
jgi:ubiquinone biosynthesis protein